jgi:hypothetical protein
VADIRCGSVSCTWYFSNSIERVIYLFPGQIEKVVYETTLYRLQSAERMEELVRELISREETVQIGGKGIYSFDNDKSFQAYPFIEVYAQEDLATYNSRKKTVEPL